MYRSEYNKRKKEASCLGPTIVLIQVNTDLL